MIASFLLYRHDLSLSVEGGCGCCLADFLVVPARLHSAALQIYEEMHGESGGGGGGGRVAKVCEKRRPF